MGLTRPNRDEDREELRLWMASQSYMRGDIGLEQLEEITRSHAQNFREAMVKLAKWNTSDSMLAREKSVYQEEYYLWEMSKLYLSGEISINELEEVERFQSHDLRKALAKLGQQNLKHRFLTVLLRRKQ